MMVSKVSHYYFIIYLWIIISFRFLCDLNVVGISHRFTDILCLVVHVDMLVTLERFVCLV